MGIDIDGDRRRRGALVTVEIDIGDTTRRERSDDKAQAVARGRHWAHANDLHGNSSMKPQCNSTIGPHAVLLRDAIYHFVTKQCTSILVAFLCTAEWSARAQGEVNQAL